MSQIFKNEVKKNEGREKRIVRETRGSQRIFFGAKKFTKISAPDRIRSVIVITMTGFFRSVRPTSLNY